MGFSGLRVLAFESRRAVEMAELIRRHGGEPVSAPALRELPLADPHEALAHLAELEAGKLDIVILMTGVGLRTLLKSVATSWPAERVAPALGAVTTVARGPKPVAALREIGLAPSIAVPAPNTWREVLQTLDAQCPVAGKRVAVQEYGATNAAFLDGLRERGASVARVPIYTWALPEDLTPLRNAIAAILRGEIDVALFTSATQVYHLFQVAESADLLRAAFAKVEIGSIGPVCSEALREHGLTPTFEPDQGKMGQLVRCAAERTHHSNAAD